MGSVMDDSFQVQSVNCDPPVKVGRRLEENLHLCHRRSYLLMAQWYDSMVVREYKCAVRVRP